MKRIVSGNGVITRSQGCLDGPPVGRVACFPASCDGSPLPTLDFLRGLPYHPAIWPKGLLSQHIKQVGLSLSLRRPFTYRAALRDSLLLRGPESSTLGGACLLGGKNPSPTISRGLVRCPKGERLRNDSERWLALNAPPAAIGNLKCPIVPYSLQSRRENDMPDDSDVKGFFTRLKDCPPSHCISVETSPLVIHESRQWAKCS